jgi:hypothetical protein
VAWVVVLPLAEQAIAATLLGIASFIAVFAMMVPY